MALVTSITNPAGLPVIVGEQGMVENGGFASVAIDYTELGKMTGKMAVEILLNGQDISTMPIGYTEDPTLIINQTAADELGVQVPEEVMSKATVVNTVAAQ